ncbi:hypothetical protein OC845_005140, partial [Tilletia horrida]
MKYTTYVALALTVAALPGALAQEEAAAKRTFIQRCWDWCGLGNGGNLFNPPPTPTVTVTQTNWNTAT